jgi:ribosomal protein S18 acetylase RimI-like enzyme
MLPILKPATPDMAPVASTLIYLTMGKMADYLFGSDNAQNGQGLLKRLFREKSNRFSYQFTQVATLSEELTGLVIAYSGRLMKSLELPMALHLIRASGVLGFIRFVKRAFPLFGVKEVENDEYFISNIAVLPAYQGRGLGKYLLSQAEKTASERGFNKISLTVDVENEHAFSLYTQTGFSVIETVEIESLQKQIGYSGFHRMAKVLAKRATEPVDN